MNNLEPVSALFTILTVFTSPQVAEILAPYIIIVIGSFTGASWALGVKDKKLTPFEVLFFYIKSILTAVLVTVFAAHYIIEYANTPDIKWLFAPISFFFGMVGNKWVTYGEYVLKKVSKKHHRDDKHE